MDSTETSGVNAQLVAELLGLDPTSLVSDVAIGNGQVAECRRWEFHGPGGEVVSVVSKSPSRNDVSRSTAKAQNLYLRETAFYRDLRPQVSITTPEVRHVSHDLESDDFLLLLEDLTPASPVDQFTGLSIDQARTALRELAGLHAPTIDRTDLFELPWLGGVASALQPMYQVILPILFDQFVERYDAELDEPTRSTVTTLRSLLGNFSAHTPSVRCVVHGDYRSENMIFDGRGAQVPLAVVDWQTVTVASPMLDVAYFLITSLTSDDCVKFEDELIDFYLSELRQRGGDLEANDARYEFARNTLQPIIMLVAASVIVERTERGDKMFLTMIRRAVDAVTRWDALVKVA